MSDEAKIATLTETPDGYGLGIKTDDGLVTLQPDAPVLVSAAQADAIAAKTPDGYTVDVKAGSKAEREKLAAAAGYASGGIAGGVAEGSADGDTTGGTTP